VARPIRVTVRLAGRSAPRTFLLGAGALAVLLAGIVGLHALPVVVFGEPLTERGAEHAIRLHLRAEAAMARAPTEPEVEVTDVDKSVFAWFSLRGSYVAEARVREGDAPATTRYYCFVAHALTGECGAWRWRLAL
jgi:hypothetical protein